MRTATRVFGLDGGGSTSRLRIADGENRALWEGSGGGVNPNAVAPDRLAGRLEALFAEAYRATGLGPGDFSAGCLGVAGADRPGERAELEALLRSHMGLSCPLVLASDPDIALVGGLRRLEGYLLVAGTGSIAIARLADGTRFRAGGLGHFLGDEGSAFFVGFQAIRRALRSAEGRDLPTAMLDPLVERFELEDASQFVPFVYRSFDKARIARAADLVEGFRAEGDALAVSIMDEARDELVALVASARARAAGRLRESAIVLWGGLFEHCAWLRAEVERGIGASFPEIEVRRPLESAAYGACMLALEAAGGPAAG